MLASVKNNSKNRHQIFEILFLQRYIGKKTRETFLPFRIVEPYFFKELNI